MANGRCRLHGGKSTGPRTPEGLERSRRARLVHGYYTAEAKAARAEARRTMLYPQTMRLQPPFVLGYDVVGEIDQLGEGVKGFQLGDRVADMTVLGSNAAYPRSGLIALSLIHI